MRQIKRILVAIKSPEAKWSAAIAKSTQLARAYGAHVELFFGTEVPVPTFYNGLLEPLATQVQQHSVTVSTTLRVRRPIHESILHHAHTTRPDLIVTDCQAGSQIALSLLQLTDWELARLSPVPVLIVKRPRLYRRPKVLAAVDPTHAYSKPLELDAQILDYGVGLSGALRGTLHAVHAYVPTAFAAEPSTATTAGLAMTSDSVAAADARAGFNSVLRLTAIPAERRHLKPGHPADTIKRVVTETGADIVVMGCMSRSGLRRLLIGNTADKLLYRLSCDLLLVKPSGITDVVSRESRRARVVATRRTGAPST